MQYIPPKSKASKPTRILQQEGYYWNLESYQWNRIYYVNKLIAVIVSYQYYSPDTEDTRRDVATYVCTDDMSDPQIFSGRYLEMTYDASEKCVDFRINFETNIQEVYIQKVYKEGMYNV
ncbi:hypothetical protein MKY96_33850 [Paenibacillus sp. FSL R7-0302]|uniref:hypothetical protein n=1 Tax=Paenibacillus sp. FSL R7-0302 TaxID=2921681 RepID=UPI0030FA0882